MNTEGKREKEGRSANVGPLAADSGEEENGLVIDLQKEKRERWAVQDGEKGGGGKRELSWNARFLVKEGEYVQCTSLPGEKIEETRKKGPGGREKTISLLFVGKEAPLSPAKKKKKKER